MRYMMMHKADPSMEAGVPPSEELMAEMPKLMGEMVEAGVLLAAEGLQPSSRSTRLDFRGGRRTVTDGPFTESKELIAGFVIVDVKSKEEAIDWSSRFAALVGDIEIDIRPIFDGSDCA
jgi:hypothetical protein